MLVINTEEPLIERRLHSLYPHRDIYPETIVLDIEASGLHEGSFPIEFGWCFGSLEAGNFLIKPMDNWTLENWEEESFRIHGLPWEHIVKYGTPAEEVAMGLNMLLDNYHVLCTDTYFDGMWLGKLFSDTRITPTFTLGCYKTVFKHECGKHTKKYAESINRAVDHLFPYQHRAKRDSINLMCKLCAFRDPMFAQRVLYAAIAQA